MELAYVRAILSDSTGKKKSPYFERAKGTLEWMWQSDNLVYKYVAMRIWQEYNKACKLKEYDLYGAIEAIILPLMFNLQNDIQKWQKKTVYNEKTYFQTCKQCGKLFRANTANIASFCGEECKKAQKLDNKRRFDEKAKDMPCERAYKTQYMFWYNRITKLKKEDAAPELLKHAEEMFRAFREEATVRKQEVLTGQQSEREFGDWIFGEGAKIDRLMEEISQKA